MNTRLSARSLPYRPTLRHNERICTRCGIQYTINPRRIKQTTECRDCRNCP